MHHRASTVVVEPHPSPSSNPRGTSRLSSGRGGAGNIHTYTRTTLTDGRTATGPASRLPLPPTRLSSRSTTTLSSARSAASVRSASSPTHHFSGRGGAGNARPSDERRAYDFEAELKREITRGSRAPSLADKSAAVVHVGRGGAGNAFVEREGGSGRRLGSVSSEDSVRSVRSGGSGEGWRSRLSRVLSRE